MMERYPSKKKGHLKGLAYDLWKRSDAEFKREAQELENTNQVNISHAQMINFLENKDNINSDEQELLQLLKGKRAPCGGCYCLPRTLEGWNKKINWCAASRTGHNVFMELFNEDG